MSDAKHDPGPYSWAGITYTATPEDSNKIMSICSWKSTPANVRDAAPELLEACKLVLLFHSGSPWDFEKRQAWVNGLHSLITTNDPKVTGANGDGTWDAKGNREDATTKNLCNAVRAAIEKAEKEST